MPVDRTLWQRRFDASDPPLWPCPTCSSGSLVIVEGSLHSAETRASLDSRAHEAWDPDWITERFVCLLQCSRKQCADVVAVAGTTEVEEFHVPNPTNPYDYIEHGWTVRYRPRYVEPAPALFRVPVGCPDLARDAIISAFRLYWTDPGACANKLRSSLEHLMDHFRIKKWTSDAKTGRRRRLDLHPRIEMLGKRFPEVADHLLAAKWIGNAGVHAEDLTENDVFDAMDQIEYALDELIARRTAGLKRIAKEIKQRKGPRALRAKW
jgi:hypothetical protein